MLAILVLGAICAGAEFFLGCFLLALCRDERASQMIGYLVVECDRSYESEVQLPERMECRHGLGIAPAGDDCKESSEVHWGSTDLEGHGRTGAEIALSDAICSIRSHRAASVPRNLFTKSL
jgi:hypothetical protein